MPMVRDHERRLRSIPCPCRSASRSILLRSATLLGGPSLLVGDHGAQIVGDPLGAHGVVVNDHLDLRSSASRSPLAAFTVRYSKVIELLPIFTTRAPVRITCPILAELR